MTNLVEQLRRHARLANGKALVSVPPSRLREAADAIEGLVEALGPFAACVEQIDPHEDDEEWAKFRLLIKDYRHAAAAFAKHTGEQP